MRLIAVIGARPNFVKVAPLLPALAAAGIVCDVVHTGQHYDEMLSDVFFADLEIPEPAWWLGVGSGTHAVQTAAAMVGLERLFAEESPDAVLVIGDVNSTLAGALAAAKLAIPVVHLEAGLRSGDMAMPEEINRLVTDQLSAMHLAPTRDAVDHLLAENVEPTRVRFVGNIMAEAALRNRERAQARGWPERAGLAGEYVLATIHRPENTDDPAVLRQVIDGLSASDARVVFPVHPRTRAALDAMTAGAGEKVILSEPLGYLDMLSALMGASAVVTDSGGIQEEACVLRVPCVTVRRNTERRVTVDLGANRVVGATARAVAAGIEAARGSSRDWAVPELWDEHVAERVAAQIAGGVKPAAGCGDAG